MTVGVKSLDEYDAQGMQVRFAISPYGASETRAERLERWQQIGAYDPYCPGCAAIAAHPTLSPLAPPHRASRLCRSGMRPHCSCPACWG